MTSRAGKTRSGWSRRSFLHASASVAAVAAAGPALAACTSDTPSAAAGATGGTGAAGSVSGPLAATGPLAELDARVHAGMQALAVPGVAVGVWYQGKEYLKGYGVTSLADPQTVTADTVFRIGSTTKTFTATAMMRLVEAGKVDLDATVRTYLPDFATSDPAVAPAVTVRQLLNHTAGWLGDYLQDFGRGDDALARFAAGVAKLPQLTPLGSTEFYQNAGVAVAGRIVEVVHGTAYEKAVRDLVLDPLGLDHTRFFTEDLVGYSLAASHSVVDGKARLDTGFWYLPRSLAPTGGLMSTVRDQLRYARFHLGQVQGADGRAVLSPASLAAMRDRPGPGGTMLMELEGFGVSWMLRPTAEGVRVVEHGGDWAGQHSRFLMVPDRDFAITLLTNGDGGATLGGQLFSNDWVLSTFAGLHNPPAVPQDRTADQLARYVGTYTGTEIQLDGTSQETAVRIGVSGGGLAILGPDGKP
ncbi:MAG: serine hydrolase domain-containing protein [Lapillicoccus sp.]